MFDEISSPFADYAIDAIQCHDFCWLLNEVFTAPQILKVMFDAENKLLWLQRDFGVFMVNLFDIQVALALLEKKRSFGEVIESHMHVHVNMRYQRADWRWASRGAATQNAAADAGDAAVLATDDALLAGAGGGADGAAARTEQSAHQPSRRCGALRVRSSTRWRPATSCVWRRTTSRCRRTRRGRRRSPSSDGEEWRRRMGLLLTPVKKNLFLSFYYWRDVVAREWVLGGGVSVGRTRACNTCCH